MLVVKDDQGRTQVYSLKDVLIYIDGKGERIKDLRTGYRADLVLTVREFNQDQCEYRCEDGF